MVVTKSTPLRGCGNRTPGCLYACVGTSPFGRPLDAFLIDSPAPYFGEPLRSPEIKSDTEVICWVGETHYPYCPDFIEETRNLGISKKLPINFDVNKLKPFETYMYFVHPRAIVNRLEPVHFCPKGKKDHLEGKEQCLTTLYYLVDAREVPGEKGSVYERTIGSTLYQIPKLLPRLGETYKPGIFMRLPFGHFEYVALENGDVDPIIKTHITNGVQIEIVSE